MEVLILFTISDYRNYEVSNKNILVEPRKLDVVIEICSETSVSLDGIKDISLF